MTRTKSTYLALLAVLLSPMAANADPIQVSFEVVGFAEGAFLSGMFVGDDANNDGMLTYSELTDFAASWSGNSVLAAFAHGFANLAETFTSTVAFDFRYDIAAVDLLSFSSCNSLSPDGCGRPTAFRSFGQDVFGVDNPFQTSSADNASYSVPEPGTLALLGIGLLGMAASRRRRKV